MTDGAKRVVRVYVAIQAIHTLAASIIWGVITLFMMESGLTLLQVMLVGALLTVVAMLFEVPTGVVADTLGRKTSFVISIGLLTVSTGLFVAAGRLEWGLVGFAWAHALLAVGWAFYSGAVDAWLVDALDHHGWDGPKDPVFARGGMATELAMLVGTLAGGALGQIDLAWPFYVRIALLAVCFVLVIVGMPEPGFERRALHLRDLWPESRRIFAAGVRHGWGNRVVRPLLLESLVVGAFYRYGFNALQPYVLMLAGANVVWFAAALTAFSSMASLLGRWMSGRAVERGARGPRIQTWASAGVAACVLGVAVAGWVGREARGFWPLAVLSVLWLGACVFMGLFIPVRQALINRHIPSAERATVLSVDALFDDVGSTAGQPALGWMAQSVSYPAAWLVSAVMLAVAVPFADRADREDAASGV